jgi:ArsR family transcriptional regulator, zinc-responsive transcriptional repressor
LPRSQGSAPIHEVPIREVTVREATQLAADLLRALANPHRIAIVGELAGRERCVHELVEAVGISQPLVSQHLSTLRAARLVEGQRRGREIAYSLTDEHVAHIVQDAVLHGAERNRT